MKPIDSITSREVRAQPLGPVQTIRENHQPPEFPDQLSQAETSRPEGFTPSKPKLVELRVIQALMQARDAGQKTLNLTADALEISQAEMHDLLTEKTLKLKEACERAQAAGVWDTLRRIGAAILGGITTLLGISVFVTGGSTLLGATLVVSGVLSLANLAFADAGVWDWMAAKVTDDEDKRKKIAVLLPVVIGLVACTAGFAGMGAAWTLPTMPKALVMVQMAANILTIGGTVAGQYSHAKVNMSQAALQELQNKLSMNNFEVDRLTENVDMMTEQQAELTRAARKLLNLTIQTKQELLV